jgi:hypothetical protein
MRIYKRTNAGGYNMSGLIEGALLLGGVFLITIGIQTFMYQKYYKKHFQLQDKG